MDDLTTVTQVLGKYYQDGNPASYSLSPLHPLVYVNKSTHEGSKYRQIEEECNLFISKTEFRKYLLTYPTRNVGVFLEYTFYTYGKRSDRMEVLVIIPQGKFFHVPKMLTAHTLYSGNSQDVLFQHGPYKKEAEYYKPEYRYSEYVKVTVDQPLTIDNVFLILTDPINSSDPDIFSSKSKYKISFDVLTLYEILTNRGSCVDIIKDYAKKITLKIFDDYVRRLNNVDKIHKLNLYLRINANLLGIDESFYSSLFAQLNYELGVDDKSVVTDYAMATLEQRLNLINLIRDNILHLA
jgi:hypothetical protein